MLNNTRWCSRGGRIILSRDEKRCVCVGISQQSRECGIVCHHDSSASTVTEEVRLVKLGGTAKEKSLSLELRVLVG